MPQPRHSFLSALTLVMASTLAGPLLADVDTERLADSNSPENAGQWMAYGRDYSRSEERRVGQEGGIRWSP